MSRTALAQHNLPRLGSQIRLCEHHAQGHTLLHVHELSERSEISEDEERMIELSGTAARAAARAAAGGVGEPET